MKLSARDYALAVVASRMAPLLRQAGQLESEMLRARLGNVAIERPLFVTGLARSGTTVLLGLLSQAQGVATHRYRDFPFLWFPVTWNWYQDRMAQEGAAIERPHRDRIHITKESAEAFEEPIWQHFFPWVHDPRRGHILDAATEAPDFEDFFRDHIRKLLMIRAGDRYVSKGNYNVARLQYLARLFPDAAFVVPIREPLAHVHSLVKQHRLFSGYAADDRRVPNYLRAAGHYEFGPQRQPIDLARDGARRALEAWAAGDDYRGYAALWAEVYAHVGDLAASDGALAKRLLVVRYEDFCADPADILRRILAQSGLTERGAHLFDRLDAISAPPDDVSRLPEAARRAVQAETEQVAARFGYAG